MSRASPKAAKAGWKSYFFWIDVATALWIIGWVADLSQPDEGLTLLAELSIALPALTAFILTALLVLFGWKRDEFAEYCWQRASGFTVKALFVLPLIGSFALGMADGWQSAGSAPSSTSAGRSIIHTPVEPAIWFSYGCLLMLSLFLMGFQWHRLRGVR